MNIEQFIEENDLTMDYERVDSNPMMNDPEWVSKALPRHYKITLSRRVMGETLTMTSYFSQGGGIRHDPKIEDVLDCLASDASGLDHPATFEEWAADYGYDPDSRRAEQIFNNCVEQTARFKAFLGEDALETLLYHVERL